MAKEKKQKSPQTEQEPAAAKNAQPSQEQSPEAPQDNAAPDEMDAALKAATEELEKTKDMLLRTAAEYDNYKKRTEREREALSEFVRAGVIKAFLPVADNIARSAQSDAASPEYVKGLEMIVKQLCEVLNKQGLVEIEAAGQPFDPNLHEAVMHVEDETLGENVVAEVLQAGYRLGDTVLRPAMVKVAN